MNEDVIEPSTDPDEEPTTTTDQEPTPTLHTQDEPLMDDQVRRIRVIYSDRDIEGKVKAPNNPPIDQHGRYGLRNHMILRSSLDRWEAKVRETEGDKVALTQVSMRKGLKIFGNRVDKAVESEMKQLHEMGVLEPVGKLLWEEKSGAFGYLIYLKEKSDGGIKGRGCANGRKYRRYIPKSEAASPTVSVEAVFITSVIDASEGRDLDVIDIPRAYLHTDSDENTLVRFDGTMAELLGKMYLKIYIEFSRNGSTFLCAKLKKSLYGCLRPGLFFWKNLSGRLQRQGFVLNPYDICVANEIIGRHQCTIIWPVDDLKISLISSTVATNVLKMLQET